MKEFFKNIISDLKVELKDEFDKNFQRKAFFNRTWKGTKMPNNKGSLMMRTGALRRSITAIANAKEISFSSSLPYASIHNEGGKIVVTAQMKKFFWAMYYKANDSATNSKGQKQVRLTEEALWWKNMALKKVGSTIVMEKRQFIGWHPTLNKNIERVVNSNIKEIENYIKNKLKR
jgi:phage gpG-like protein